MGGNKSNIQDINKLVSMLTSESETITDDNLQLNEFDTVTSITSTSVLEDKLRELFNNQLEGGAKKKRSKKKNVDVEEDVKKGSKKSAKKGSKKAVKKGSEKAAKKGSK